MSEVKPVPSVMPGFFTVTPEKTMPEEMEVPISAEGEAHLFIPVLDETETLTIDVRRRPLVVQQQQINWDQAVKMLIQF